MQRLPTWQASPKHLQALSSLGQAGGTQAWPGCREECVWCRHLSPCRRCPLPAGLFPRLYSRVPAQYSGQEGHSSSRLEETLHNHDSLITGHRPKAQIPLPTHTHPVNLGTFFK